MWKVDSNLRFTNVVNNHTVGLSQKLIANTLKFIGDAIGTLQQIVSFSTNRFLLWIWLHIIIVPTILVSFPVILNGITLKYDSKILFNDVTKVV